MSTAAPEAGVVVRGVVKNGVVELPPGAFPEGAEVGVTAAPVVASEPVHNFRDADGNLLDLTPEELQLLEENRWCVLHAEQMLLEWEREAAAEGEGADHAAG